MYDPDISAIIRKAFMGLHDDAKAAGSFLGESITNWIQSVYNIESPEDAFTNPDAFPLFLLPWYAETSLNPELNKDFQYDLIYSTSNGYYYIRFIDNLMDGHSMEDLSILPILSFFSINFHKPYYKYFDNGHPFWKYFNSVWLQSAEASILDAQFKDIDKEFFVEVSARKTCAVKIPVAAVFYYYESPKQINLWEQFINLFGCWHQMWDDIRDFPKDERDANQTYFLSEANRRKKPDEFVIDWVIREGHDWGMKILDGWMVEMEELVIQLNSPKLIEYINDRRATFSKQKMKAEQVLKHMEEMLTSLKGKPE